MKPILFNADMVRAILADRKTVTRRVVKPPPEGAHTALDCDEDKHTFDLLCGNGGVGGVFKDWVETIKAPFWPGDILYVQETFLPYNKDHIISGVKYAYKANATPESERARQEYGYKWRPSIHMPREAARIFLLVTDVRVERLKDITEEQAVVEGCAAGAIRVSGGPWGVEDDPEEWTAIEEFSELWDRTIKPADRALYGWEADPWVWVIAFERCEKPKEVTI